MNRILYIIDIVLDILRILLIIGIIIFAISGLSKLFLG